MIKSLSSSILVLIMLSLFGSPVFAAENAPPGDVENFKGTVYDGAVRLTWDSTTDDVGVAGYRVYYGLTSVSEVGQKYDEMVDVGNTLDHLLTGLKNDTTYYLSVVAYDTQNIESARWAEQLELIPKKSAGDYKDDVAPKVVKAEALNKEQVIVEFSEEIVLPSEDAQDAFQIENDDDLEPLVVTAAEMYEEDAANKTVLLTTQEQADGATYKLTVTIDIEDKASNPVISGTSDTAIFDGSGEDKPATDSEGPFVVSAKSVDNTHIQVEFNETIVLGIDPAENFSIAQKDDDTKELVVLGVELEPNSKGVDDATAVVVTSPQDEVSYIVSALDLKDEAGNDLDETKSSTIFDGSAVAVEGPDTDTSGDTADTEAPKDATKLLAEIVLEAGKYIVKLSWNVPTENIGDATQQILYLSTDNEKFNKKSSLDPEAAKYEVTDLEAGEYWVKLTQKDAAGNESEGIITKVTLAETGPEMVGLLLVSLGLGRMFKKKKV